jgi:hypothetical protein
MGNGYHRPATRTGGVDEDQWLAVGVQRHEDGARIASNEGVSPADQTRPWSRALARMPCLHNVHPRAVHLMEGHKVISTECRGGAPALAHRPSIGAVTGRAIANIAIGESHPGNASGDAMGHSWKRGQEIGLPQGKRSGRVDTHSRVSLRAPSRIMWLMTSSVSAIPGRLLEQWCDHKIIPKALVRTTAENPVGIAEEPAHFAGRGRVAPFTIASI